MRLICFLILTTAVTAQEPQWIKGQTGDTAVTGTVELNRWIHSARIYLAAEADYTLLINGKEVLKGSDKPLFKILKIDKEIKKDF